MSMFNNYENIPPNYVPNNSEFPEKPIKICECKPPYKIYDVRDRFIGYTWNCEDITELTISVNEVINVPKNSLIFNEVGEEPVEVVEELVGLKSYNTVDGKSWTLVYENGQFNWVEDDCLTYFKNGEKQITIIRNMEGKCIEFSIYNFRGELVHNKISNPGEHEITLDINEELNTILKSEVYNVVIRIVDEHNTNIIDSFIIYIS